MIISEKQIFKLMELVEYVIDDDIGLGWKNYARFLMKEIIDQQSEELKVIE